MSRASRRASASIALQDEEVSIPAYLGDFVDSLEYVVTLGLGTPAVEQVVLMDTGSDLSWVQCKPCTKCYPQKDPLFDPRRSSTYAPISCGSDACKRLRADEYDDGCTKDGNLCGYWIGYWDGSNTTGVYSSEALTLAPGVVVHNFRFGCGHLQVGPTDMFDGLLGLGALPDSLPTQTSAAYGAAFSYCLPPVDSDAGFLALGAPSDTSGFVFTPMRGFKHESTFYEVTLTGISVAGKKLDVPSARLVVDSGTVVSELPTTAYRAVRSAFRAAMSAYPLVPSDDLETCYNFTGYTDVTVPRVTLTFGGGAKVDLDVPNGVLLDGCLAFYESEPDDIGVIGNVNQRTLEVLYDTGNGKVGFRPGAC